MNYIEQVADAIKSQIPKDNIPKEDTRALFSAYALLLLAKGGEVTSSDVHNAWAAWMTEINPRHDAIKPFDQLDEETKKQDAPFLAAIRATAERLSTKH